MLSPLINFRRLPWPALGLLIVAVSASPAAPAAAQEFASSSRVSRLRLRFFNPFSPLRSDRISNNRFGLPQFQLPLAAAPTGNGAASDAGTSSAESAESDAVALPAVGRPTYRPQSRSPFRPAPRPPFL